MVLRAQDVRLGRPVAIKIGHPSIRKDHQERFVREGQVLARLDHPNLIAVHDLGVYQDFGPILIMQYVDGASLEEAPPADPLPAMLQVADALDAVHAADLLHRDVKPANILLRPDGRPLLIDFGLVFDPDLTPLTATGKLVGSLGFMAPELLAGTAPTPASDWYAWGATLYLLLEGRLPYSGNELMAFPVTGQLPPVEFETVPADGPLADTLRAQLSPRPADRITSAPRLHRRFAPAATTSIAGPSAGPATARPRRWAAWTAAFLVTAATSAWWLGDPPQPPAVAPPPIVAPDRDLAAEALAATCREWRSRRGSPALPYSLPSYPDHLQAVVDRLASGMGARAEEEFWENLERWLETRDATTRPVDPALVEDLLLVLLAMRTDWSLAGTLDAYGATVHGPAAFLFECKEVVEDLASVTVDLKALGPQLKEVRQRRLARIRSFARSPAVPPVLRGLVTASQILWVDSPESRRLWKRIRQPATPPPPGLAWLPGLARAVALDSELTRPPADCSTTIQEASWLLSQPAAEGLPRDLGPFLAALRLRTFVELSHRCDTVLPAIDSAAALAKEMGELPPRWRVTVSTRALLRWAGDPLDKRNERIPGWSDRVSLLRAVRREASSEAR